jgi:hypothetical protein
MFGIEHLTVGGYITDGSIVCRECGEKRKLPASESISVASLEEEWPFGLTCGACDAEIVATPRFDVDSLWHELADVEGFTRDIFGNKAYSGYAVSLDGFEIRVPQSLLTRTLFDAIAEAYGDYLRDNESSDSFGAWLNDGVWYFDLSEDVYDLGDALARAERRNQKAIWDVKAGAAIVLQPDLNVLAGES